MPTVRHAWSAAFLLAYALCAIALAGCSRSEGRWQEALQLNTVAGFEKYAADYPDSKYFAQAKVNIQNIHWIDRIMSIHIDDRELLPRFNARLKDRSAVDAMNSWGSASKGKLGIKADFDDLFMFIGRYNPIWKDDLYQKAVSDIRVSRIAAIEKSDFEVWRKAIEAVHEDGVSELWVLGFIIDLDSIFVENGYDRKVSALMLERLKSAPKPAVQSLAEALKTGLAQAAVLLIQNEAFFGASGFQQSVFDTTMSALSNRIASRKK